MIKILYVVPNLYTLSGVTNVIMNYYRKINKKKFKIDFLVIKKYEDSVENELLAAGSKVFYMKNKISLSNMSNVKKEIHNFYKNNTYDFVELHAPTFSFLFLKEAKNAKVSYRIIHTHSTSRSTNRLKNIISYFLNLKMLKYSNLFFSCSQKSGKYWFGDKICSSKDYYVVTNGIDISNYVYDEALRISLRKELNISNNFVVGFVGRMSSDKNLFFLIDVINKVIVKNPNVKLVVVGDGKIANQVKKYSKKLGDSVMFLGVRNDVNKILNCFDLLLLPSRREGLPMVAVEAQITNIPCFLSDTITKEVDLGNAKFISLSEKCWVDEILNFSNFNKDAEIDKAKFDIVKCVDNLEHIYSYYYELIGEK